MAKVDKLTVKIDESQLRKFLGDKIQLHARFHEDGLMRFYDQFGRELDGLIGSKVDTRVDCLAQANIDLILHKSPED